MNIVFTNAGTHLDVACEGVWDPVEVTETLRMIRAKAEELTINRLLIDWSRVSAPKDSMFRVYSGEDAATFFPPPLRTAVLQRKAQINKVAEKVALSRGADVLVHHDRSHLLAWLLAAA